MINVLVCAVGSPLGQSVTKALIASDLNLKIFCADHSVNAAGLKIFSNTEQLVLPSVSDPEYSQKLDDALHANNIEIIFPLLKVEFDYFAKNSPKYEARGIKIIMPDPESFVIANDKFASMGVIAKAGLAYPKTALLEPLDSMKKFLDVQNFPVLIKPRWGASSNDVHVVKSKDELTLFASTKKDFVVQEHLSGPEFTVGVFLSNSGEFSSAMVIQRELKFGLSYSGTVIRNPKIEMYAIQVARSLKLKGSVNVQLKYENEIPKAFEVNPRLSSTTSIRAHFGFNEIDLLIRDALGMTLLGIDRLSLGSFARYWEEVYF